MDDREAAIRAEDERARQQYISWGRPDPKQAHDGDEVRGELAVTQDFAHAIPGAGYPCVAAGCGRWVPTGAYDEDPICEECAR